MKIIIIVFVFTAACFSQTFQREIKAPILSNQGNFILATDLNVALYCKSKGYEFKSMGGEAVEMIPNEYYASSIHPNGDEIERLRYLPSTTNRVAILNSVMCEYRLD